MGPEEGVRAHRGRVVAGAVEAASRSAPDVRCSAMPALRSLPGHFSGRPAGYQAFLERSPGPTSPPVKWATRRWRCTISPWRKSEV